MIKLPLQIHCASNLISWAIFRWTKEYYSPNKFAGLFSAKTEVTHVERFCRVRLVKLTRIFAEGFIKLELHDEAHEVSANRELQRVIEIPNTIQCPRDQSEEGMHFLGFGRVILYPCFFAKIAIFVLHRNEIMVLVCQEQIELLLLYFLT